MRGVRSTECLPQVGGRGGCDGGAGLEMGEHARDRSVGSTYGFVHIQVQGPTGWGLLSAKAPCKCPLCTNRSLNCQAHETSHLGSPWDDLQCRRLVQQGDAKFIACDGLDQSIGLSSKPASPPSFYPPPPVLYLHCLHTLSSIAPYPSSACPQCLPPDFIRPLLPILPILQVLAKLGSSQNKPNKQAIVLPRGAGDMMQVRARFTLICDGERSVFVHLGLTRLPPFYLLLEPSDYPRH